MSCSCVTAITSHTMNTLLNRKNFANKQNFYPKSLQDMVDIMRQVTPKKKRPGKNGNDNGNNKNDQGKGQELEASNAQTTKGTGGGDDKGNAC